MDLRYKRFEMKVNNVHGPVLYKKLEKIGRKMEALDYKFKNNLKFDPETKMWKLSMDNKIDHELKVDGNEIKQDLDKFVASKPEVQRSLGNLMPTSRKRCKTFKKSSWNLPSSSRNQSTKPSLRPSPPRRRLLMPNSRPTSNSN